MFMRRAIALTCLSAVLATGAAMPAAALSSSGPTFDSITWSHPTLAVSGMQMVRQTGTVHIVDPYPPRSGDYAWYFTLVSSGGNGSVRTYFTGATLTSGTVDDGTWTMTFYLSSTADGTWHVTEAEPRSPTPDQYPVADTTSFTVTGHHQPRMSWAVVPNPVPASDPRWLVKGRVYDADTGAGLAGLTVGQGEHDTECLYQVQGEGAGAYFGLRAVTNANGYYSLPRRYGVGGLQCIGIVGKPERNPDGLNVFVWFRDFGVRYLPSVSATPRATVVPAGSIDAVDGHVLAGTRRCTVALQRLYGSTAWRTVSTARLRDSLRFTVLAQPPAAGRFVYRAYYPPCFPSSYQLAATSPRFTITGT